MLFAAVAHKHPCLAGDSEGRSGSGSINGYISIANLQPDDIKERVICSVVAAVKYDVPANIVLAVAEMENGKPGQYVQNTNGTYDVGPMQFNTCYLAELAKYAITPEDVANTGCYPYELAAWRLRGHIRGDAGDVWTRAANYHSRTPKYNAIYRAKLIQAAQKWADWLARRFNTRDVFAANTLGDVGKSLQHETLVRGREGGTVQ